VIGAIVGGEGVMALWVPLIFAAWSDTLRTRIGGRLPFIIAGGVPAAVVLGSIGLLHGLGLIAAAAALFFFFYFIAYEPYRAMYPDLMPEEVGGRAQSAQAIARGLGTGCALLGGGLLLSAGRAFPFLVAAFILITSVIAFVGLTLRRGTPPQDQERAASVLEVARSIPRHVWRHPALRGYFVANALWEATNALWEATLAALKTFIILYLTVGLGYQLTTASLIIGGVAAVILFGAGGSGALADRYGRIRVVSIALVGYSAGFLVPFVTTSRPAIGAAIPFIALGGGTVMTMAYALLMPLMPRAEHGALTGVYSISRGVGITFGPAIAGALIWLTGGSVFSGTHGFQAVWIVCAVSSFASLYFLRRMGRASEDRHALQTDGASEA
jgi:predicted MFS family arabinose efflux permease